VGDEKRRARRVPLEKVPAACATGPGACYIVSMEEKPKPSYPAGPTWLTDEELQWKEQDLEAILGHLQAGSGALANRPELADIQMRAVERALFNVRMERRLREMEQEEGPYG
jgi:hypothetical protein